MAPSRTAAAFSGIRGGRIRAIGSTAVSSSSRAHRQNCCRLRYSRLTVEGARRSRASTIHDSMWARRIAPTSVGRPSAMREGGEAVERLEVQVDGRGARPRPREAVGAAEIGEVGPGASVVAVTIRGRGRAEGVAGDDGAPRWARGTMHRESGPLIQVTTSGPVGVSGRSAARLRSERITKIVRCGGDVTTSR